MLKTLIPNTERQRSKCFGPIVPLHVTGRQNAAMRHKDKKNDRSAHADSAPIPFYFLPFPLPLLTLCQRKGGRGRREPCSLWTVVLTLPPPRGRPAARPPDSRRILVRCLQEPSRIAKQATASRPHPPCPLPRKDHGSATFFLNTPYLNMFCLVSLPL